MARIARRVLDYRERQRRGATMRPSNPRVSDRKLRELEKRWLELSREESQLRKQGKMYGAPGTYSPEYIQVSDAGMAAFEEYERAKRSRNPSVHEGNRYRAVVDRLGTTITRKSDGASVFLQGEDASEIEAQLDTLLLKHIRGGYPSGPFQTYAQHLDAVLDAYDDVMQLGNPSPSELKRATRERAARIRGARLNPFDWREQRQKTGTILDEIRHGDKVTILAPGGLGREGREYVERTGTAVMRGPHGWVLNMGGRFGTPGIATAENIVKVRKVNPAKAPKRRKGESVPAYHKRRVRAMVEKMPPQIRAVFDRNPSGYQFIFTNPDEDLSAAEDLYKTFHGRDPREILEISESAEERGEYTGLGDLVELTIDAPNRDRVIVQFKDDGVRLASSPEGTQLYLLGGNQDISSLLGKFGADSSKDLVDLGDLKQLVYEAAKWQTDYTPQEWKHDLGEESGIRPRAFFDQLKKRIFFAGGNYRVKRPGIVD